MGVLIHNLQTAPGPVNVISFDTYGGQIGRIPENATAFPHRNAMFVIQYLSYWEKDEDADKNIRWIEQFRNSMLPYTRGAYRDYVDSLIADWPTAYFGENLAGLMDVKKKIRPRESVSLRAKHPIILDS